GAAPPRRRGFRLGRAPAPSCRRSPSRAAAPELTLSSDSEHARPQLASSGRRPPQSVPCPRAAPGTTPDAGWRPPSTSRIPLLRRDGARSNARLCAILPSAAQLSDLVVRVIAVFAAARAIAWY